jgi:acetyl-CoA carboxylase biotin carboxyl carrier protein
VTGAAGEIAVAEHHDRFTRRRRDQQPRGERRGSALAEVAGRGEDFGTGGARQRRGGVRRGVVGDDDPRPRERGGERGERLADPLRLVVRAHEGHRVVARGYRPTAKRGQRGEEARVANVEAHITGTVWKIEVSVGDTVEEGDTVLILESMKMEMPVEAEDEGTVKEILVEEGQSVSEGDALVVLE